MTPLTVKTAHLDLVRNAAQGRLTEEDALLWMVLLHTHKFHIKAQFADQLWRRHERDGIVVLDADTQRGVASVIAELWGEIARKHCKALDDVRDRYEHWYWEFNVKVPYETVEMVPLNLRPRLEELRNLLARDPRIADIVPDD